MDNDYVITILVICPEILSVVTKQAKRKLLDGRKNYGLCPKYLGILHWTLDCAFAFHTLDNGLCLSTLWTMDFVFAFHRGQWILVKYLAIPHNEEEESGGGGGGNREQGRQARPGPKNVYHVCATQKTTIYVQYILL